jgi:acylphosphatase
LAVYNILMNHCRRFLVSGRVQGVFFRAATEAAARRLGVTGWVRNLVDGSVELVACGEDVNLAELERWLWQGPPRARVEQVQSREAELQSFSDFSIRG